MIQKTDNLRVRRMQKLLREALLDLIEERGFDALTVSEIIQRAMVSRTAFYRNYQDKYDLVERIFDDEMRILMSGLGNYGPERPPRQWVNLFKHVAEYKRLYRSLLGGKGSSWFVVKMRTSLAELVKEHAQMSTGPSSAGRRVLMDNFIATLLASLFVDAIIWWLEQDNPYTPEEMALYCSRLAGAIFEESSTWQ